MQDVLFRGDGSLLYTEPILRISYFPLFLRCPQNAQTSWREILFNQLTKLSNLSTPPCVASFFWHEPIGVEPLTGLYISKIVGKDFDQLDILNCKEIDASTGQVVNKQL